MTVKGYLVTFTRLTAPRTSDIMKFSVKKETTNARNEDADRRK